MAGRRDIDPRAAARGGGPLDPSEVARLARKQNLATPRERAEAPSIEVEPAPEERERPSMLRGAAPGQLGRIVLLDPTILVPTPWQRVLQATGDDRNPELVTLTAAVIPQLDAAEPYTASQAARCRVMWGVGAAQAVAVFTPRRGSSITLTASSIQLDAMVVAPGYGTPEFPALLEPVQVAGLLSFGSRPGSSNVQGPVLEEFSTLPAITPNDQKQIPAFGSSLTITSSAGMAALVGVVVNQLAKDNQVLASHTIASRADTLNIDLVSRAYFVQLTGLANDQRLVYTFGLSL